MKTGVNLKQFYDSHTNFTNRRLSEYNISPGIKCKFDTILDRLKNKRFHRALDIGCSGNSFIHFLPNVDHRILLDLAHSPLVQYQQFPRYHAICGSITKLPFLDKKFDLVVALDVLEHIPDDITACSEITRILASKGYLIITVPHRMAFYTKQDHIVGHVRRYEYKQIHELFTSQGLTELTVFPVYGQAMRLQFVQEVNPKKTEENLTQLRKRYTNNSIFRNFWSQFVRIGARVMRWDAKFQPFSQTMDICLIFQKSNK